MHISNMTVDEVMNYGTDQQKINYMQQLIDQRDNAIAEYKNQSRSLELAEEAVYFARELLDEIELGLNISRSIGQARKAFTTSVENSYFER